MQWLFFFYQEENPDLRICEYRVPFATELVPLIIRIKIVERFQTFGVDVAVTGRTAALNMSVCLSRMCFVLDESGLHICRWMKQQRFDSKALKITKFRIILHKNLTIFMEIYFSAGSVSLCQSISSWTLPGTFLTSEEKGKFIRWTAVTFSWNPAVMTIPLSGYEWRHCTCGLH